MDILHIVQTLLIYALPVLFAITLHEAAHGYVALRLGDNTAYVLGRVTMNPLRHIDPIGTIAMPLFLYLATSGNFVFGYAKPVPVQFGRLRFPKRDMVWVALAGPLANLIQALLWAWLLYALILLGLLHPFLMEMCRAGVASMPSCLFLIYFQSLLWMGGEFWLGYCHTPTPINSLVLSLGDFSLLWGWY